MMIRRPYTQRLLRNQRELITRAETKHRRAQYWRHLWARARHWLAPALRTLALITAAVVFSIGWLAMDAEFKKIWDKVITETKQNIWRGSPE